MRHAPDPALSAIAAEGLSKRCCGTAAVDSLASHDMARVERLPDHVPMLKRGRLADGGSPAGPLARYGWDDREEVFPDIARDRRAG